MVSKFKKIIGFSMILGISILAAGCLRQTPAQRPQPKRPVQKPVEQNQQGQLPSSLIPTEARMWMPRLIILIS